MRRSPDDSGQPQDQRLLIFVLLSVSMLMFWRSMNLPEPPVQQANQQAEAAEDEDEAEPADDGAEGSAEPEDDQAGDEQADAGAAPVEEAPEVEPQSVTIGSAQPGDQYRMLMTLSNQGAVAQRLILSSDEFSDIDNHAGSLGVYDFADADNQGARLEVVGPGSAAYEAGLRSGDVLTSGKPVGKAKLPDAEFADAQEFRDWLAESKPGQQVELTKEDGSSVKIKLTRPALQLIRPEHENVLLHQEKLPVGFEDHPSFLVRLVKVGERSRKSSDVAAANVRLEHDAWAVEQQGDGSVAFTMRLAKLGLEVVKRFSIAQTPVEDLKKKNYPGYHFELEVELRNLLDKEQEVAYQIEGPNGLPIEGFWYANKVGRKVNGGGAWGGVGLRDVIVRYHAGTVSQMNPTQIAKDKYQPFGQGASLAYAGVDAQYFAVMMIPQKESLTEVWFDEGDTKLATMDLGPTVRGTFNNATFTLDSRLQTLKPVGQDEAAAADKFTVFAGPKRPDLLGEYFPANDPTHSLRSILYYGWFGPVAKLMLGLLHTFYSVVRNYGVAIVMLTVVVRLLMFPLSRKQAMNMVKMQELKPEIDRIAEKYKSDMEKRTKAQQDLFRKHNYNPMGGCLLMFIQLPVFLGLYRALAVDVELREASVFGRSIHFLSNLASPDMFFDWSAYMPHSVVTGEGFFGLGPYLNLLPIVTVVLFLLQQKMFMPEPTNEQAAMQQKMMKYMMGFMGFMFFKVPSGLCMYFITSSLWGITERKLLPKPTAAADSAPASTIKTEPPKKIAQRPSGNAKNSKKKKRKR